MNTEWQKEMQRKMESCRKPAPDIPWPELERKMTAAYRQRQAAATGRYKRMAAAVAALAVFTATTVYFSHTESPATQTHTAIRSASDGTTPHVAGGGLSAYGGTNMAGKPAAMAKRQHTHQPQTEYRPEATATTASGTDTPPRQTAGDAGQNGDMPNATGRPNATPHKDRAGSLTAYTPAKAMGKTRLSAKIYMTNAMSGYDNTGAATAMLAKADPIGSHSYSFSGNHCEQRLAQTPSTVTDVHHRQPVRVGLGVRYRINDRWSVESGLTYSYLYSDITSRNNNYSYQTEQRLHYIGIPVSASYSVWRGRHLNVYATAGGMVEKAVSGKRDTRTIVGNETESDMSDHVSIGPLQLSANMAVGAEYLITPALGVYLEPGLSYYFDNGSATPTVYSDKPLNFSLSLGLRFNIR